MNAFSPTKTAQSNALLPPAVADRELSGQERAMVSAILIVTILCMVAIMVYQFTEISDLRERLEEEKMMSRRRRMTTAQCTCTGGSRPLNGVAITTFLGAPKWFQNRYSMMVAQVLSILPSDWKVQIFYNPTKRMAMNGINHPGIRRLIEADRVILTAIPDHLTKLKQKELLVDTWYSV